MVRGAGDQCTSGSSAGRSHCWASVEGLRRRRIRQRIRTHVATDSAPSRRLSARPGTRYVAVNLCKTLRERRADVVCIFRTGAGTLRQRANFSKVAVAPLRPRWNFSKVAVAPLPTRWNFSKVAVAPLRLRWNFSKAVRKSPAALEPFKWVGRAATAAVEFCKRVGRAATASFAHWHHLRRGSRRNIHKPARC